MSTPMCNDNYHNHNEHGRILNAIHDVTTSSLQTDAASTASIIASNERLGYSTRDSIEKNTLANRDAIERNGDINSTATERVGVAATLAVERNGLANLTSTERNGAAINLAVERTSGEIKSIMEKIASENRGLMYQHNTQSLLSNKDVLLEMCKNTASIEKHSAEQFAQLQLQAANNKASIELEACKNKEALSAQLAKCCCELKESILSSGSTTQQLIRDNETNRVRDALTTCNTENLILRLSNGGNGNGNGNNRPV